jgi:hypothetical protein
MIITAPTTASRHIHTPLSAPTAAVAHSVAAVLSPITAMPALMITPAPQKADARDNLGGHSIFRLPAK